MNICACVCVKGQLHISSSLGRAENKIINFAFLYTIQLLKMKIYHLNYFFQVALRVKLNSKII